MPEILTDPEQIIAAYQQRLEYFEAEDRRKAQRIDDLQSESDQLQAALDGQLAENDRLVVFINRVEVYQCSCGEKFTLVVWHCPHCAHHWPLSDIECGNCHQ